MYYKESYENVGTQSALIAGFTVAVLVTLDTSDSHAADWWKVLFHVTAFVALLMLLYTLIIVTFVTVLGPGLALRGKDPVAMEQAVVFIKKERGMIYASFFCGVSSFIVMSLCCAWILMDESAAVGCSAFLGIIVMLLMTQGNRIWSKFNVRSGGLDDIETRGSVQQGGLVGRGGSRGSSFVQRKQSETDSRMSGRISFAEAVGDGMGRETLTASQSGHRASAGGSMSAPLLDPVGPGGADVVTRGSGGDSDFSRMDVLVTELVNNHGGWLSKRTKPGFNGQPGWKKRWIGIYDGMLFYSKTQAKSNQMSDTDAKSIKLSGFTLMAGSDGLTIRMLDPDDKSRTVDWKAGTQEDREAWIHYMRAGIATADRQARMTMDHRASHSQMLMGAQTL